MHTENKIIERNSIIILADVSSLAPPVTGVGKYAQNIILELAQLNDHEIYYFMGLRWKKSMENNSGYWRTWIWKFIRRYEALKVIAKIVRGLSFRWSSELIKSKSSKSVVFYSPNYKLPFNQKPKVVVIHDLCHEREPGLVAGETLRWLANFKNIAKEADGIITVSEFTKQETVSLYGIPEDKIKVASPGIDKEFTRLSSEEISPVLSKYNLAGKSYFLSVATLQPRKNLSTLVKAYLQLSEDIQNDTPLILVGYSDPDHLNSMHEEGFLDNPNIRYTGYLPDEDLPALYNGALAFCSSSLYEGFGIPVAEALACGTPCLLSDIPSYREISPQHTAFYDPLDIEAWSKGLLRAVRDKEWIRSNSIEESVMRERYNWRQSALTTLSVLYEVANR